jgi:hypothetical protein
VELKHETDKYGWHRIVAEETGSGGTVTKTDGESTNYQGIATLEFKHKKYIAITDYHSSPPHGLRADIVYEVVVAQ